MRLATNEEQLNESNEICTDGSIGFHFARCARPASSAEGQPDGHYDTRSIVLGSGIDLTDSADLSGGVDPTGAMTFFLFAPGVTPNGTDSNNIYSDTVTVIGDGTYTTAFGNNPGGYLPVSDAGAYQWLADYSGNGSNNQFLGAFGNEPETVSVASPAPEPPSLLLLGTGLALFGLNLTVRHRKFSLVGPR